MATSNISIVPLLRCLVREINNGKYVLFTVNGNWFPWHPCVGRDEGRTRAHNMGGEK